MSSYEIPQEVTPIHEIQLVCEEEFQIFREGRYGDHFVTEWDFASFDRFAVVDPVVIGCNIGLLGRVHAREEKFESRSVFVSGYGRAFQVFFTVITQVIGCVFGDGNWRRRVDVALEQRT